MKPKKILIIDDDLLNIINITQILLRSGYQICHESNHGRALQAVRQTSPDLVIFKLRFGDQAAQTLVQEVRRSTHSRTTLFLFLAERLQYSAAPDILGPKQLLTRPFSEEQLLIAVQDQFNQQARTATRRTKGLSLDPTIADFPVRAQARGRAH